MKISKISITPEIQVYFSGPPLHEGPLPALFYLALSAEESLSVDPFNQPAAFLSGMPIRVFSMTLPGHGPNLPAVDALKIWAKEIQEGHNIIDDFTHKLHIAIDHLLKQEILIEDRIAVAGLSRGAFIAAHAAERIPHFKTILGFAPLTKLTYSNEFENLQNSQLAKDLDLLNLVESLSNRSIRFYIGNHDLRVGTDLCFQFVNKLVETAFQKKVRSPPIELIIGPSIGYLGHGTAPHVFKDGALWAARQLKVSHELQ